jgi:hypothetical protein
MMTLGEVGWLLEWSPSPIRRAKSGLMVPPPRTGEVSVGGRDHLVLAATEAKRESGLTIVTDRMFSPSAATRLKSSALLREWPTAW